MKISQLLNINFIFGGEHLMNAQKALMEQWLGTTGLTVSLQMCLSYNYPNTVNAPFHFTLLSLLKIKTQFFTKLCYIILIMDNVIKIEKAKFQALCKVVCFLELQNGNYNQE